MKYTGSVYIGLDTIRVNHCQERFLRGVGFVDDGSSKNHLGASISLIKGAEFRKLFGDQCCRFGLDNVLITPCAALLSKSVRQDRRWSMDNRISIPAFSFDFIFLSELQATVLQNFLYISAPRTALPVESQHVESQKEKVLDLIAQRTLDTVLHQGTHDPGALKSTQLSPPLIPASIAKDVILAKIEAAQIALLVKYIKETASKGLTYFVIPDDLGIKLLDSTVKTMAQVGWQLVSAKHPDPQYLSARYFVIGE